MDTAIHAMTVGWLQCDQVRRNFTTLGENLRIFGNFLRAYLGFGKILYLPRQQNLCFWANFHC